MQAISSVSIIMKVWNALAHVRLCLKTLLHSTDGPFELIVIDNGSQPAVVEFLRATARDDPRVRLVENPTNVGPGLANCQGVALAKNRLICLIDSDVLVPQGWLARLVAEFERRPGVKLLAPLNYHQTLSHPFGPENSAAAWFRTRKEYERASPLRQFHAYSGGLSIDEFDELMCSAHAGELAAHDHARPTSSGPAVRCWTRTSSRPRAASPIPGSPATAAKTSICAGGSASTAARWRAPQRSTSTTSTTPA